MNTGKSSGHLMEEELKKLKIRRPDVLADISKAEIAEEKVPFKLCEKAIKELPLIAGSQLLSFKKGTASAKHGPLTVGILFSGGPASGGHNIIAGLFDALKELNPDSQVIGFMNGADGLLKADGRVLTEQDIDSVRNQGGFYLLGTSRTKVEKKESFDACIAAIKKFALNGLLVAGGDDSNTNAAHLAARVKQDGLDCSVIGIPKTIDGDLAYPPYLQTSFGFYTAARTYSEMVGNICRDLPSSKKIWHFVKLMGRSASWITLETAFQTQPNIALIGEEIKEKGLTISQIIDSICEVVEKRHGAGKKYGIVLIPEGIVEFIPEIKELIKKINAAIVKIGNEEFVKMCLQARREVILVELNEITQRLFAALPQEVQNGLLCGLDPHGNVQVSQIASEVLIMDLVCQKLEKQGIKLTTQTHFYGYDGRCGYPTVFDATYTYNLGRAASLLVAAKKTGYLVCLNNLTADVEDWKALAIPLAGMMSVEERKCKESLVISKYMVDLKSKAFLEFVSRREKWALEDSYLCPGPIQFWGPKELVEARSITMALNS